MAPFDPAAATAAYLAALPPADHARAVAYTQGGHWLLLWGWLVGVGAALLILKTGVLRALRDRVGLARRPGRVAFVAAAAFVALDFLIELPWSSYAGWARERQYLLTSRGWGGWFADQLKGLAVGIVVGGLLAMAIYALMRRSPRGWWGWSTLVVTAFLAVSLLLGPVLIEPMFNSYRPAPAGPVRDQIVGMARVLGVPGDRVLIYDGSRQSNRYTANVAGVGGTARVALSDTMFAQGADLAEVRGVVGHEMGHYVLHHSVRLVLAFSGLALALFWLVDRLFAPLARLLGEEGRIGGLADPAGLPLVAILVATLGLLATPITSSLSRGIESEADAFSLAHVHEPDGLSRALVKTIAYRAATPGRLEETIFYDHPAVGRRVARAMAWKAAHPGLAGTPPSP